MKGTSGVERLDGWVTLQAARRPDSTAVVLGDDQLTYGELEALANRLARCLIEGGCRSGDRIAVLMPKTPVAIAAIVAIYRAGAIYVPLDPAGPATRLALILRSCEPSWILAAGPVAQLLDDLLEDESARDAVRVGWLGSEPRQAGNFQPDFTGPDLQRFSDAAVDGPASRHDIAHILFTSGSTGTPKGVMITHSNVLHFVEWAVRYFAMSPEDRISGHSPLFFDLSVLDIFGAFAAGSELHLVPPDLNILPHKLAEFIRCSALTQWFSVPSVLNYMAKFDVVRVNDFPSLRRVLWCGEVFPTPALVYWMKRLPHATFTNLYGPTETTIASSYYTLLGCPDDETANIPIGSACPGEDLLVLGDGLREVPSNEAAELYIRGVGLSPGYWRDPERTHAAFIPNPHHPDPLDRLYRTGDLARIGEDGLVYFVGRADSQIKSRGYRIELGEIETAMRAVDGVTECAVVATASEGFEGAMICCAYVPAPGTRLTPARLRAELSRSLPGYMLPFRWLALEGLPKTANGKIDRRRLMETFQEAREREAQAPR